MPTAGDLQAVNDQKGQTKRARGGGRRSRPTASAARFSDRAAKPERLALSAALWLVSTALLLRA